MIHTALRFLSAEVRGLHAAAFVLAFSALLSSLLALGRDRLLAHTFGAGADLDIYYAAFRIPDLFFVATGALVSVYILIPQLSKRTFKEQNDYLDTILAGFLLLSTAVAGLAAFFAPTILSALYPQFVADGSFPVLVMLTRIMLLQPILLGVSNILAAITQSKNRYTLYSISPLLYNIGIILGVLVFYPVWGMAGLAYGVLVGAFLHMAIQVPSIVNDGFLLRFPRIRESKALFSTAFVSLPRALALSMNQISFFGLVAFAGLLTSGSIAIFIFAYNLQAVPLAIMGASYSVAAFPTLAAALSRGERESFLEHVAIAARYVFFWSLPATALILVLRAHLVRVVLGSGNFDWVDTRLTAAVFAVLALSLAAQGISLLLIRAYYAAGRTFVPFAVSAGTATATLGLAAFLLSQFENPFVMQVAQHVMRLNGIEGSEILALALAYAISSIAGACVLLLHFEHRFGGFIRRVSKTWWESVLASIATLSVTYLVLVFLGPLDTGSTTLSVFLKGFAGGLTGLIVAGTVYWMLGSKELEETVLAAYGRYFKRTIEPAPGVAVATPAEERPGQS
jgi:putative peptidoglycan lipid II flippase